MSTTLIIPGLQSSGPTHWQTWLEQRVSGSIRVQQRDWNDPHLPDWSARIRREIARTKGKVFIVAHSFGVLAGVQAASDHAERIAGALLVAPADPESFRVAEFLPAKPLGFPAIVVASTNDPWMTYDAAAKWAGHWKADIANLGAVGHINSESGFGPWPESLALLERLRRTAEFRLAAERLASLRLVPERPILSRRFASQRSTSSRHSSGRPDVECAVTLLREAGWTLREPEECAGA
jgi:serine hydrolase